MGRYVNGFGYCTRINASPLVRCIRRSAPFEFHSQPAYLHDVPYGILRQLPPATKGATSYWSAMLTSKSSTQGIYVHWPFCLSRCPYCDFNAHVWREVDQHQWRNALLSELDWAYQEFDRRPVSSIFFGGGTPSLMPPTTVSAIIERINANWSLVDSAEITLEANPTSAESDKFVEYSKAGVNRISVGVQSLRDESLRMLGRTHTVHEARKAVDLANRATPRSSFDLISALPHQSPEDWRAELSEAVAIGTEHMSIYQLTIEPGTRFAELEAVGNLSLPDPDRAADIFEITAEVTEQAGLPAYEISNHAKPGAESRHNLNYWRGGQWIGIGPGAHGRPGRNGKRLATEAVRDPANWLHTVHTTGQGFEAQPRALSDTEVANEYLMCAIRLAEGVNIAKFSDDLRGPSLSPAELEHMTNAGLLRVSQDNRWLQATPRGRLVLNEIVSQLLATAT